MSSEAIQAITTAYFTHLQAMNPEPWAELFTEEATICDPVGTPPRKAREGAQQFFGQLSMIFETLQLSQDKVFTVKDGAAAKWTMQVWGRNGKQGTAEGISVFEIYDGKIQQVSSYWDDAALMAQIRG